MSDRVEIVGSFAVEHHCAAAIEKLRDAGFGELSYFAPIPSEHLLHAAGLDRSPVRAWVLTGGITGALSGFALTIGTSLTWSHVAGGKPIISMPPYIIIAFELMILFGGISAVIGFLTHARVPALTPSPGYSDRFSADRFGAAVRCAASDAERVERLFREAGAEEVVREEVS